jgi:hypothetical protein
MSSHFNYEIDEKNLRSKLREMSYPFREDAWSRFDSFSESIGSTSKARNFPQLNLNINRGVIIPVIFGAGILLLSLLLYNFISINNDGKTEHKEVAQQILPPPVQEKKIAPVVVDTAAKIIPKADTVKTETVTVITPTTNTVAANIPTVGPIPTQTVTVGPAVQNNVVAGGAGWYTNEATDVYTTSNIASKKIGAVPNDKGFTAIEETKYFIKVNYDNVGNTGYILKVFLRNTAERQNHLKIKSKKESPAEELPSKPVNTLTPTGNTEEKEPELR